MLGRALDEIAKWSFVLILPAALVVFLVQQKTIRDKSAAIEAWSRTYSVMLSNKDEEIQRLKWLYRITPRETNPRPKGRG